MPNFNGLLSVQERLPRVTINWVPPFEHEPPKGAKKKRRRNFSKTHTPIGRPRYFTKSHKKIQKFSKSHTKKDPEIIPSPTALIILSPTFLYILWTCKYNVPIFFPSHPYKLSVLLNLTPRKRLRLFGGTQLIAAQKFQFGYRKQKQKVRLKPMLSRCTLAL